jgi:peptidoglycan hydrolase CwlO-like protein
MSHIKEIQKQIAELNKNIQQNQGDVNQLQEKLNQLMIAEFEETMREESDNSQQLLKG